MENLAVSATAAGTVSFTLPQDRSLVAVAGAAQVAISRDPNATYTNVISTPAGQPLDRNTIFVLTSGNIATGLKIPLLGGEAYFVCFKAAGCVVLYLDEV